nr:snake venom 5'-nucleotidase isoform X1 [Helicoverpa armigera]
MIVLVRSVRGMASFAAQAALRSRWSSLIESTSVDVPGEVTDGVRSVVGWLKQASLEVRQVGRRAVSQLAGRGMGDEVVIIHFNDVYNIEPTTTTEPVGGALRFSTAVKALQHLNPLVLFSGDVFSPSMLSTFTKGEQMVPVLNEIGTHCAVFGNHDFDFGLEVLSGLVAQCNFPWLMSNVIDNETGRPLGDGKITHALMCNGHKIGFIGLVEQEWLETLATINPEEVTFIDFVQAGTKLASQLKQEGCEYVIALTHMRTPNDIKLAEGCNDIDLILGGHDHVYEVLHINNKYVVKSGTDFRQFSKISINFADEGVQVDITEVGVNSSYAEDLVLKEKTDKYSSMIEGKMDEVLGKICVPLEGRFSCIRRQECNLGNWVCDVLLAATGADLVVLNSGTFRSDQVHAAGDFTLRDLSTIIPMRDPLVVVEATGEVILQVLENAVSKYPSLEGRFPQVAGVSFAFDPSKPAGQRVAEQVVKIGDEYLQRQQVYRLAIKQYLYSGNDGFNMLPKCKILIPEDMCPEIGMAIQNHFAAINVRTGRARPSKHRQSLVTLSRRHSLVKMLDGSVELDGPPPLRRASSAAVEPTSHGHHRLTRRASLDDLEQQSCELAPKLENRIIVLNKPEELQALIAERTRWESDTVIREVDDEGSP